MSSSSFDALGVPADLVSTLKARGIDAPFPIQALTVADALAGRDVSGRAPTGSGKTLAFGIPLVARLNRATPRRPRALVLAPTRELAAQIATELAWLGRGRRLRVAAVYGGSGYGPQVNALRKGVDILVACPGRLWDLIERSELSLDEVEVVVVDEADHMADMGFLPTVKRILDTTPGTRQTLLFSATLDGEIDVLVRRYQRDAVRHLLPEDDSARVLATHAFWGVERDDRVRVCAEVIAAAGPTIVFCKTKHGTDALGKKLAKLGVRTEAIHGNRSQGQRERALAAFSRRRVDALIATDVAARGIHVDDVACVVHFDPPHDAKDYTHRSGRTARAGARGAVVSFVTRDQKRDVVKVQRALGLPAGITAPNVGIFRATREEVPVATKPEPVAVTAGVGSSNARADEGAIAARRGVVKWFDARKGYGFIDHGADNDLFVHHSALPTDTAVKLREGHLVEFRIARNQRGEHASAVRVVG